MEKSLKQLIHNYHKRQLGIPESQKQLEDHIIDFLASMNYRNVYNDKTVSRMSKIAYIATEILQHDASSFSDEALQQLYDFDVWLANTSADSNREPAADHWIYAAQSAYEKYARTKNVVWAIVWLNHAKAAASLTGDNFYRALCYGSAGNAAFEAFNNTKGEERQKFRNEAIQCYAEFLTHKNDSRLYGTDIADTERRMEILNPRQFTRFLNIGELYKTCATYVKKFSVKWESKASQD